MEKLTFGALLKTAFKRCVERRLSRLIAMQMLLSFLALLPFLFGGGVLVLLTVRKNPADVPLMLGVFGAMALYYLPCLYLICLIGYGFLREILYPEARIGRGLKSGFARWKVAFYPIPWWIAAAFIGSAVNVFGAVCGEAAKQLLSFVVGIVLGIVSSFLLCAVAASDTGVRFGELYRRTFAALKNGWGRYLGGLMVIYLLWFALLIPTVIMGLLFFYPAWQLVPFNIGIPVFAAWMCLFVWAAFRVWVFFCVYLVNLFVDASGISRAEMGLPDENGGEAETPVTAEIPAPETPEAQATEQDK